MLISDARTVEEQNCVGTSKQHNNQLQHLYYWLMPGRWGCSEVEDARRGCWSSQAGWSGRNAEFGKSQASAGGRLSCASVLLILVVVTPHFHKTRF